MPGRSLAILVAVTIIAGAQEPAADAGRHTAARSSSFRAAANLVLIGVSVWDRNHKFVAGLDPANFHVTDENQPVPIRRFAVEEAPVSTVILVDTSGSMRHGFGSMRAAVGRYLQASLPGDDFCLLSFADAPAGRCAFTTDPAELLREMPDQPPRGGTALIDSMFLAFHEVERGANARRAVLVLTDGLDTHSRYTWSELKRRAEETTASIYAVTPEPWGMFDTYSAAQLREISELTGGAAFQVGSIRDYPDFLGKLDIRKRYMVGFAPAEAQPGGAFHRVRVTLDGAARQKAALSWRRGYFSPSSN